MHKPIWSEAVSVAYLSLMMTSALAQSAGQQTASPQQMLDFLAKPAVMAGKPVLPSTYPAHYAEWDDVQKKSGMQLVAMRCGLVLALEHDNPAAHMLPPPLTSRDESKLGVDVCFAANMPTDWTERGKYLSDADTIITDAYAHGATLHLPAILKR